MNNSSAMGARTLASKVFAVLMSVILVLGLSPVTKVSYASTASDSAAAQASAESVDSEGNGKAVVSDDDADAAGKAASDASAAADAKAAADTSSAAADAKTSADAANDNAASSSNQASTAASSSNNSTEPASNQEGIALASASDSVEPGKYGSYTYKQNSTKNAFESSEYDAYRDSVATNLLGVAGSFHITAFDKATTSSHIYGNILTKELVGSNNFGLDSRYNEKYGYQGLSYVQNYTTPSGQPDGHEEGAFVIGSNNTVTTVDNGNHLAINGVQLDKPKTLIQDTDTANNPFIDLDAVKAYTIGVSDKLAAQGDVGASITTDGGKTYINYEGDSGCAYVTMTAKQLNEMDELYVKGMELNGKCSVVINVDMDGATELNLSKIHVLLPDADGQTAGTGETDSTVGYVMFNIKKSTSDMTINLSDRVLASVLAPNSTINLGGSAAGTYIATNVNVTAESHARPFRGVFKPVTTSAKVTKQWLNAYGSTETRVEHDAVKVQLYQSKNGGDWTEYGEVVELSNANSWSYDWGSSLPKKDTDGNTYEYKVVEVSTTADYNATVTNSDDGWTITNRHVAVGKLTVSKAWKDAAGNVESGEHDAVTVKVMRSANGTDFEQYGESIQLSKDNNWSATVDQLPLKDADGKEYSYKAEEDVPDGYAASYSGEMTPTVDADGNKSWSYSITNTSTATNEYTDASVTKEWLNAAGAAESADEANAHGAVKAQLYQSKSGGEATAYGDAVTLSRDNSWSAKWDNLLKTDIYGNTYTYTVKEADVPSDYTSTVTGEGNAFKITNKKDATVTVAATKAWSDNDDVDKLRPAQITATVNQVAADGTAVAAGTIVLSAENGWKAQLGGLPVKDASGNAYSYTIAEGEVAGYAGTVSEPVKSTDAAGNSVWSFALENTHAQKTTSVKVTKEWSDSNDQDGIRPASVSVDVLRSANGKTETVKTLELSADNGWAATADGLPVNGADGAYAYSISEAKVEGYASSVAAEQTTDGTWAFKLTNTHETEKVKVDVKKVWNDSDNKDLLRTSSVTAQLYTVATVDGQEVLTAVEGKTVELKDGNNWSASWEGLPAKSDGKKIKYTVRETEVPNGYTVTYQGVDNNDGSYAFTMTNTIVEGDFSLSGYSMQASAAPVREAEKVCYVDPKVVKVLDGRALKAGEFSFQLIDATGEVKSTASNDASGMVDFDAANPQTPDGMEPCCLTFTAPGTYSYTVREDSSQVKDSTVEYSTEVVKFIVVIGEGADGALVEADSYYLKYDSAADAAAGTQATKYASTDHPTITNSAKPLSLSLTKTSAETGEALEGAVYGLYKVDENAPEGEVKVMAATSNANGVMTFSGTDADSITTDTQYFFREISAPAGYTVSENKTQTFTIQQAAEGGYQLVYADGTVSKAAAGTAAAPLVAADVTDSKASITFGKVASDGTPLSGAKLAVKDSAGNDVDVWETDATGHVINDLVIGDTYVLYEKQAPEGYQTAAEVTFKVDEYGKVAIISGASSDDVMNAYATGSTLNLVDYKKTELVEKKETVREEGVPAKETATTKKSALAKTSDQTPFIPVAVLALSAIVVAAVARRRTKRS
jgi:hypothetical protein